MIDLSIFLTAEAWISLLTLMFLEIVLGVDNIAFIALTTARLPKEHQHLGRRLGLAGAMIMRCVFLCFASWLVHMTDPVFTVELGAFSHGFSVRDILLGVGGVYLVWKGASEVRSMLRLEDLRAQEAGDGEAGGRTISLPRAVGTIMVMDIVFSIDSVITAVGLADQLIVMIIAVIAAVLLMMAFIDQVSDFINAHAEMKVLALVFIAAIGVLLVLDALGFHTGLELIGMPVEKLMVYFAMVFSLVLEFVQMAYGKRAAAWREEHPGHE